MSKGHPLDKGHPSDKGHPLDKGHHPSDKATLGQTEYSVTPWDSSVSL